MLDSERDGGEYSRVNAALLSFRNTHVLKGALSRKTDLDKKAYFLPGDVPYSGLYGEAPPKRGTIFRLGVYKRVGISVVEVWVG